MTDHEKLKAEAAEEARDEGKTRVFIGLIVAIIFLAVTTFGSLWYAYDQAHRRSVVNEQRAKTSESQTKHLAEIIDHACKSDNQSAALYILCKRTMGATGPRGPRGPTGPPGPAGKPAHSFVIVDFPRDGSTTVCVRDGGTDNSPRYGCRIVKDRS